MVLQFTHRGVDVVQAESESRQLRARVQHLTTTQAQNKVCIDQLVSRLQEAETYKRTQQGSIEALRQQVDACREDFNAERRDRRRTHEYAVNLERQLTALRQRVGIYSVQFSSVY